MLAFTDIVTMSIKMMTNFLQTTVAEIFYQNSETTEKLKST